MKVAVTYALTICIVSFWISAILLRSSRGGIRGKRQLQEQSDGWEIISEESFEPGEASEFKQVSQRRKEGNSHTGNWSIILSKNQKVITKGIPIADFKEVKINFYSFRGESYTVEYNVIGNTWKNLAITSSNEEPWGLNTGVAEMVDNAKNIKFRIKNKAGKALEIDDVTFSGKRASSDQDEEPNEEEEPSEEPLQEPSPRSDEEDNESTEEEDDEWEVIMAEESFEDNKGKFIGAGKLNTKNKFAHTGINSLKIAKTKNAKTDWLDITGFGDVKINFYSLRGLGCTVQYMISGTKAWEDLEFTVIDPNDSTDYALNTGIIEKTDDAKKIKFRITNSGSKAMFIDDVTVSGKRTTDDVLTTNPSRSPTYQPVEDTNAPVESAPVAPPTESIEWLQVYGKGSQADPASTYLEFFADDSPYLPRSGGFYIRRLCVDCRDSHNDIIYKRLTPLPDGFSIFDHFLGEWASENNKLNEDFELYGNMLDALAGRNKWTFCNYDDHVGFPRDCGPDGFVGGQWNSYTRGGRQNYGFYVYRGNVDPEPALPSSEDQESLDRWLQVFGKGSLDNSDIDSSLWGDRSEYVPDGGEFYVRRICQDCVASYQDIIYKRVTPLPDDFDLPDLFVGTWSDENNSLITPDNPDGDFELYSSMSFALAGLMPWKFCNYNDNHIGFPRDCGTDGFRGGQWTSLTRGGKQNYGYYVWKGNAE